jgi:hypothetical protein
VQKKTGVSIFRILDSHPQHPQGWNKTVGGGGYSVGMVRKEMETISYHEYGTRAANACKQSAIAAIFSLPLIDAIKAAKGNETLIRAVIAWNGFDENLDRAMAIIHSAAYMQAHYHLQDLQKIERAESLRISELWLDDEPIYPHTARDLHPAPIVSMVEVLTESSMPSHAPTAAATSELQSVSS